MDARCGNRARGDDALGVDAIMVGKVMLPFLGKWHGYALDRTFYCVSKGSLKGRKRDLNGRVMVAASGKDIFEAHLADVMNILREEVAELVRLGATYIQLDAPHYTLFTLLLDPAVRAFYESQGWSVERYLERGIELDNAVIGDFPGLTFGFHLCRGNQGSRWLVAGGYDPIAGPIFRRIRASNRWRSSSRAYGRRAVTCRSSDWR